MTDQRPFADPSQPGRRDTNGVEWWACDPYPTWYRRDADGKVVTGSDHCWRNPLVHTYDEGCVSIRWADDG